MACVTLGVVAQQPTQPTQPTQQQPTQQQTTQQQPTQVPWWAVAVVGGVLMLFIAARR
jgi:hypothetical protein